MYVAEKKAGQTANKDTIPVLLVFPFGHLSHYLRCLTLAKQFSPYFDIRFAHHDRYAGFIEKENFRTFSCLSLDAEQVLECVKNFDFSWMNKEALEAVYHEQVKVIERYRPLAILGDTSPTLKMAAEKTGVLYISLMNGYMSKCFSGTRKLSRTHPGYRLLKTLPRTIQDIFTEAGEYVAFKQVHKPFRQIRENQGLSATKNYLDELEGDINLICDLPELFPQKALPPGYAIISPLYYEGSTASVSLKDRLDKTRKTIFVSMGSTGDWNKVNFLDHPAFQKYNVIAAGDTRRTLQAEHIIHTDFVNTADLFPFTDLVICHGGNGTIYQALAYGIPVLCKTNHFEQEWNVDALERFQLGRSLDELGHVEEYTAVVAEWVNKKPLGLSDYPGKIRAWRERLPETISGIASSLQEHAVTKCN